MNLKQNKLKKPLIGIFGLGVFLGCIHTATAFQLGEKPICCGSCIYQCNFKGPSTSKGYANHVDKRPILSSQQGRRRQQAVALSAIAPPIYWRCWFGCRRP